MKKKKNKKSQKLFSFLEFKFFSKTARSSKENSLFKSVNIFFRKRCADFKKMLSYLKKLVIAPKEIIKRFRIFFLDTRTSFKNAFRTVINFFTKSEERIKFYSKLGQFLKYIFSKNLKVSVSISVAVFMLIFGFLQLKDYNSLPEYVKMFPEESNVSSNDIDLVATSSFKKIDTNKNVKFGDSCRLEYMVSLKNIENSFKNINPFDMETEYFSLNVDGRAVGVFKREKDAQKILDKIISSNKVDENVEILEINYKEDVKIEKKKESFLLVDKFSEENEVMQVLMTGTKEKRVYAIQAGDIPETIAEAHGITIEELEAANPDIIGRSDVLQIGEELNLIVPVPMIHVLTTEKVEYKEELAYQVDKEKTSSLYEGEERVKISGVKGEREVVAKVVKQNGVELSKEIISEKVLLEPKRELLLVGTKPAPPKKGTGVLTVPVHRGYVVTSEFGPRWGRHHNGIDLGMRTGSPILAADGGVVITAGWVNAYGYTVEIDHGGNIVTLYAHCNALHVSVGEKVFKGQHIADVGNTGFSYGSHLHFEVRKNNVPQNPRRYLGF